MKQLIFKLHHINLKRNLFYLLFLKKKKKGNLIADR